MKHVLAVDGGNSKTLAVIADETGHILALRKGPGSNYQTIGRKAAAHVLSDLIKATLQEAGLKRLEAACYGLAGADRDKDFQAFWEIIRPFDPARKSVLVNDTLLALRAGAERGVGVALIGGAGSNCVGMDRQGRIRKTWGLGPLSGDKANAGALALDAVIAAMKGFDGRGPKTLLEKKFKQALKLDELEDIIAFEFFDSRREFNPGSLAPLVFEAADQGDEEALRILKEHGRAVAEAALAVLRALFSPDDNVPLVLGGSVLQKGSNPALVNTIRRNVRREFPKVSIVVLADPPVMGAIMRALDEAGRSPSPAAKEKIRKELSLLQNS